MGICTFFCFFGLLALVADRLDVSCAAQASQASPLAAATKPPTILPPAPRSRSPSPAADSRAAATTAGSSRFAILVGALLVQSLAFTVVTVLWPLVMKDRFALTSSEFGVVAFVAALGSTCSVAAFPALDRRAGPLPIAAACAALAAAACAVAFVALPAPPLLGSAASPLESRIDAAVEAAARRDGFVVHCTAAVVLQASLLTLEPSLKSLLSLYVPPHTQGRSLGLMATLGGVGGMGGNIAGTWLYAFSKGSNGLAGGLAGGALPFAAVSGLLLVAAVAIWNIRDGAVPSEPCEPLLPELVLHVEFHALADTAAGNATDGMAAEAGDGMASDPTAANRSGTDLAAFVRETSYDMKLD
jgi:hypothetical protein